MSKHWSEDQPRGENKYSPKAFAPKWTPETVTWIIEQLHKMTDFVDIQVELVKRYKVSLRTTENWIEMSRRIMDDMNNGLDLDEALDRDRERRNMMRRKNKKED